MNPKNSIVNFYFPGNYRPESLSYLNIKGLLV